ncbi:MAG: amylo-alpha-1,6-glucosidase [Acidimicrobiia bacterium]
MTGRTAEAFERSVALLADAATPAGFVASPAFDHYAVIWARDGLIAALGALDVGEPVLVAAAGATLDTLSAHASALGQIPAVVAPATAEWDFAEGGVVDATAWFVLVVDAYARTTGDLDRVRTWWPAVQRAMSWLRHQDVTGSGLISAAPSTDWMDAALTRSGRTLHLNALYAGAAASSARVGAALGESVTDTSEGVIAAVNAWFWPDAGTDVRALFPHGFQHDATRISYWEAASANRRHYVSHIVHSALIDRCDTLANLLAIRTGIADDDRAALVLDALDAAADPYPTRTFPDPIRHDDGTGMLIAVAESSIPERWRNRPGRYHNGAAWPYIGGFHVEMLARSGDRDAAREMLIRLAEANALDDWCFPEWIDAEGVPAGASLQTWNAATYVLGFRAVDAL